MPKLPEECSPLDALGNPVRREIIEILHRTPCPVGELAEQLPVSRPAVSKHLRLLERAGLVASEVRGTRHVYRLDARGFEAARGWLDGFWDEALARFRLGAESLPDPASQPSNSYQPGQQPAAPHSDQRGPTVARDPDDG